MKEGCATALVLNKWDVAAMDEADLDHERARVAQKLRLRPKVLTASAKTGAQRPARPQRGDHPRRADAQPHPDPAAQPLPGRGHPGAPAAGQAGPPAQAALHGQFETAPPRFSIQVNSRNRVTRDYAYFIENRLRARYGMDGVPLIIDFNERKPRRDASS
jgi:GTP-binding protein